MQQRNGLLKTALVLGLCAAFVLGLILFVWIGNRIKDQRYGLSLAPEVSHTRFADNESRVRLVINPDLLLEYIERYLPQGLEVPGSGQSNSERLSQLLPREIAMLARSDLPADKIYLTLFANERRGGPRIQVWINSSNVFARTPKVNWTSNGLELRGRGILVAEGVLTLPASLKETKQRLWPTHVQDQPTGIKGGHLVELAVDNINGDILSLVSVVADLSGEDWINIMWYLLPPFNLYPASLLPPSAEHAALVSNIIGAIDAIRVTADLKDENTLALSIRINVPNSEDRDGTIGLLSGLGIPVISGLIKKHFNLVLDGSILEDKAENSIVGNYILSGIQGYFKNAFEEGISWIDAANKK